MEQVQFGFVRITQGTHKDKIARYIEDDEKGKVKITFSYDQDFLSWPVYSTISKKYISSDITLIDLVDRYYHVVHDLNRISLRGHPKIKKFSAKHNELINESHLIRVLLKDYTSPHHLQFKDKEKNIYIAGSFKDTLWINDMIAELSIDGWHICFNDHELHTQNDLDFIVNMCSNFIFVVSDHYQEIDMKREYSYILKMKTELQKITFVSLENESHILLKDSLLIHKDSEILRDDIKELENRLINHDL